MATATEIKQLFDFDLFGGLDSKGNIKTLDGKQAFINSLKMWLLSKENDYIRQPGKGGYLYNWLMKPLSPTVQQSMLKAIRTGLQQEFTPTLFVESLEITPDYNKRTWTIVLKGYVPEIKDTIIFTEDFRSLI